MTAGLEFGLLGPLLVRDRGIERQVPPGGQRAVLAALLLDAGRVVADDVLAEVVWGASPPESARAALRNLVSRLRAALGDAGRGLIVRRTPGYVIAADAIELDVMRFERFLMAARAANRDGLWDAAAAEARAALTLWRGEPLADAGSELLTVRDAPRLAEMRLLALETRLGAELRLGRDADVLPELRSLAAAHPLRENLHAQLMLALYRDGRQAEALDAYQHARQVLIDELGSEPGAGLRDLHRQILAGDAALTAPGPARVTGSRTARAGLRPADVPRQLPAAVPVFAGRHHELAVLARMLDQPGGTTVITAIGGTAGVGKTALAVYWSHQVAAKFPDGQLFVNLRGFDPSGPPVPPADAVKMLLEALGVPRDRVPGTLDGQAGLYRSLVAGQRMLIVLDNARDEAQVRPLLPGSVTCRVVVTSRNQLTGLVAIDAARLLALDVLTAAEAHELLQWRLGADRLSADPDAAARVIQACAFLPLALSIIAARAEMMPGVSLAQIAAELAAPPDLGRFSAGPDPAADVRKVLSWSYRQLDAEVGRAFRLAGLHPGPELDRYSVAALTGPPLERADQVLAVLAHGSLMQPTEPGRYRMHDLLKMYARELAEDQDERQASLTRLFDYYLHTASAATDVVFPDEYGQRPHVRREGTALPVVAAPAAARAWLDTERASLTAVTVYTAAHGWPGHATRLAAALDRYLYVGSHHCEAIAIHGSGRDAARETGDKAAEATALRALGVIYGQQGRCEEAAAHLRQALDLYRLAGDRLGEAHALNSLGGLEYRQGRYREAFGYILAALALYREAGDRVREARLLGNLGIVHERQGRYQQAADHQQQALVLLREIGDRDGQARALSNLGVVELRRRRFQQAADHLRQAVDLLGEAGDRTGQTQALASLGAVELRQGHYQQAADHIEQALTIARETGDLAGEAAALNDLGDLFLATGQPGDAGTHFATALDLASQADDKHAQADAHQGLGNASCAAGDPVQARRHWREALALYAELDAPEAGLIRVRLAEDSHVGEAGRLDGSRLCRLNLHRRELPNHGTGFV